MSLSERKALGRLAHDAIRRTLALWRQSALAPVQNGARYPAEAVLEESEANPEEAMRREEPISVPEFDALPLEDQLKLGEQGLFIIGSARSGTTILQDALNDSLDIFLFGEPDFHRDPGTPDFGRRYNALHRSSLNQETKGTFCPRLFSGDATWSSYLLRMMKLYRYVGAKIVLNPRSEDGFAQLFDFHTRYFYRSHYIFTFRNPLDTIVSINSLASYTLQTRPGPADRRPPQLRDTLITYVCILRLFIRMKRIFPFVSAMFHDDISSDSFVDMQRELGVDISRSARYYSDNKVTRYNPGEVGEELHAALASVVEMYEVLRKEAATGFELAQINQNDNNVLDERWAPLGHTMRKSDLVLEALRRIQ